MNKYYLQFIVIITLSIIVLSKKAHAYLDPGTGSYVIQVLLAVLFGSILSIKIFWNRIKVFIDKIFLKRD